MNKIDIQNHFENTFKPGCYSDGNLKFISFASAIMFAEIIAKIVRDETINEFESKEL